MKHFAIIAPLFIALAACGGFDKTAHVPSNDSDVSSPHDIVFYEGATFDSASDAIRAYMGEDTNTVVLDKRIAQICEVPQVRFAFDSDDLRKRHEPVLDELATCFTHGPLEGAKLKLVGHADPRGTTNYNFALGHRRAGEVAEYLQSAGVDDDRITVSSRGELEADGDSPDEWADDRRVEVLLDI